MCGIAGIVAFDSRPPSQQELESMCAVLTHRGPDDAGFYLDGEAGLAMRRLSIIDLLTGRQPVHNEDGTVHVVLNGEIYNYRELRHNLESLGHSFYTATDTEVIVHLYEEYGQRCVERLRGMFAFALWDGQRRRLLLARDRLGIKPLYYVETEGRLAFASELKALLELPEVERRLNWDSVNHLFTFLTTPSSESIVAGVHKLEPGSLLMFSPGHAPRIERYWTLEFEPDEGRSEAYFIERLRELLDESITLHLESDVPVGAFLSGGIDSSSVVAAMSRLSPRPVKTFSIGFREPAYDESAHARRVAEKLGTEHRQLILEPDAVESLEDIAWHLDEPFGDSSAIPTYLVSKLAAREVKVVLSGDGGDELFAGYDKYRVEARERRYERIPAVLRRALGAAGRMLPDGARGKNFLRHIALEGTERYLDAVTLFHAADKKRLFRREVAERLLSDQPWRELSVALRGPPGDWLAALQHADLKHYLPLDILTKVDRMSMAHSLEVRVPLLDHRLVEFAASVPAKFRMRQGVSKDLFKKAMRGRVPDAAIDRPKQGFAVPLGAWFRGGLTGFLQDLLLSETCRRRGIFEIRHVERLIDSHQAGRPLDLQLWTLVSFELWCRRFLDRRGGSPSRRPEWRVPFPPAAAGSTARASRSAPT